MLCYNENKPLELRGVEFDITSALTHVVTAEGGGRERASRAGARGEVKTLNSAIYCSIVEEGCFCEVVCQRHTECRRTGGKTIA
ncbi:unnamed protein product [Colias eurytheme]|nr:unnamed protein product [Colias eurytheme]